MDIHKMYACIGKYGEGCFGIVIYCDGSEGCVAFWSDGTEIVLDVDQPENYSEAVEGFVFTHANFTRLVKLCRRVLRRARFGYVEEVPVSFCFR